MLNQQEPERSFIPGSKIGGLAAKLKNMAPEHYQSLRLLGIDLPSMDTLSDMQEGLAKYDKLVTMDALQATITTPTVGAPIQFLQQWLPGFVAVMTAARHIDDIVGISVTGSWEQEEVVVGFIENTGMAVPYGDYTNVPLASWSLNYLGRTVVRFEEGLRVGALEEARAASMNVSTSTMKRNSAANALEIQRNSVGFYGYNNGNNLTYGFLNDPLEPAYVQVNPGAANGGTAYNWSQKQYLEIAADIRVALSALRQQSGDNIDPNKTAITFAIASNAVDFLGVTSIYGTSVIDWLTKTYPNVRVVSAPELNGAHAGDNVFYMFADTVDDGNNSSDDKRTFTQMVPTKYKVVGMQTLTKGYEEDYTNATAGVFCKRPIAVVRYYNI